MKKIEFSKYKELAVREKLSELKSVFLGNHNYFFFGKIDLGYSSKRIESFYCKKVKFADIGDFYFHVSSIPYRTWPEFDFPPGYLDQVHEVTELTKEEFQNSIDTYFYKFMLSTKTYTGDFPFWKININLNEFIRGYKVEGRREALAFISEIGEYYMYFKCRMTQ